MTRALLLGAILWGVLFTLGSVLEMSVESRPLAQSVLAVLTACVTVGIASAYVGRLKGRILWRACAASLLWVAMCWALDFLALSVRAPTFSWAEYWAARGLVYLMIPVIALAMGYQRVRFEPLLPAAARQAEAAS